MDSHKCEFGQEISLVIPYLYWLHVNGTLQSTVSLQGMKYFYFFSSEHSEERTAARQCLTLPYPFPASSFHDRRVYALGKLESQWLAPPLKNRWLADGMSAVLRLWFDYDLGRGLPQPKINADEFDIPIVLLHNKRCNEWGKGNVNHIPDSVIRDTVEALSERYLVVYCRPTGLEDGYSVDQNCIDQHQSDFVTAETAGAVLLQTLMSILQHNVNLTQLLLHSVASRFISVQGGNSVLASFFGGVNIIYAREGVELRNNLFDTLFKSFSACRIHTTSNVQCLKDLACQIFL